MIKIFACGNADRGDDGAGLAVARLLLERGIEASIHTGDPLALLDRWHPTDDVILVDAVVTGARAGTIHVWDSLPKDIPASTTASSHGFDIAKAIDLARALGRLPDRLRIYGIEGRQFDAGGPISPEVEDAIKTVGSRIAAEIQADIEEQEPFAYSVLKAI